MDNLIESWLPIDGYEDSYMVSSLGKVKSLKRHIQVYRYGKIVNQPIKESIIGTRSTDKYLRVRLVKNGKVSPMSIHRLVAIAFVENPNNKPHVNHINGNKRDNRAINLEWCDACENMQHAVRHGLMRIQKGESNNYSKLTEESVREIRRLKSEESYTNKALGKLFNVTNSTIGYIIKGKTWKY